MKQILKTAISFLFAIFMFANGINAQNEGTSSKIVDYKSQFKISATAYLFNNINIKNTGESFLTSKAMPSAKINFYILSSY